MKKIKAYTPGEWNPEDFQRLREKHGITQTELAKFIGIPQPCISVLEKRKKKGEKKVQMRVMTRIALDHIKEQLERTSNAEN